MPLSGDEKYVMVQGTLRGRTARGVEIETVFGTGWVGRSCLHFITDQAVDKMDIGDEGEFRIMEWVATKNGFI
jgi:hypothetical protein